MSSGVAIKSVICDEEQSVDTRLRMLYDLNAKALSGNAHSAKVMGEILSLITDGKSGAIYRERLDDLMAGPMRYATFLRPSAVKGTGKTEGVERVDVIFDSGENAAVSLPDFISAKSLSLGDTVVCDKGGYSVLATVPASNAVGEETALERIIGTDRVLIQDSRANGKKAVYRVTEDLEKRIRAGMVRPGDSVIVCHRRQMAFDVIPAPVEEKRFRFLSREPVPNVVAERDMANPPKFIAELSDWVRVELTNPAMRRKYALRRCATRLLEGVSGSGKTLSIMAVWRAVYQEMADVCGVAVDELPHRVFRLRAAEVLSKWYGESDRNLDEFFSEVEEAAREEVTINGKGFRLPVIAVLEEIDGLTAVRGSSDDSVQDRLLTTLLQRLDTTRREVADSLILFLATTNVASRIDSAVLRRIGAKVETFGRLDRKGFVAVTEKVLRTRPIAEKNVKAFATLAADRVFALWAPTVAVVKFAGNREPMEKKRGDFLTAAVVDAAAESAAEVACERERAGGKEGVRVEDFVAAVVAQVDAIAGRLDVSNVASYVDLPKGAAVVGVQVEGRK